MAYQKPTPAQFAKCAKQYGEHSVEYKALSLVAEGRVPIECIADLMQIPSDFVKADLVGAVPLEGDAHGVLINCLTTIIPIGLERGLLPCKDLALTTEILRVLVEILQLQREIRALQ